MPDMLHDVIMLRKELVVIARKGFGGVRTKRKEGRMEQARLLANDLGLLIVRYSPSLSETISDADHLALITEENADKDTLASELRLTQRYSDVDDAAAGCHPDRDGDWVRFDDVADLLDKYDPKKEA